ncbi:hypothetical protein [Streptomyces sp. NPDC059991]|uniref:hypothetical protein n=1 Tax=unclassified Streptomyces TaxID=2593676 RepID=UPI0036AC616C
MKFVSNRIPGRIAATEGTSAEGLPGAAAHRNHGDIRKEHKLHRLVLKQYT